MWKSQFHRSKQDEHVESYSGDANEDEAWGRKYEVCSGFAHFFGLKGRSNTW